MFDTIIAFLKTVWDYIRKLVVRVLDFVRHICHFFSSPRSKMRLREKDVLATVIRQNLDDGNVSVINCLFDKGRNVVLDVQDIQVITAEELDERTSTMFGDKNLLVLS